MLAFQTSTSYLVLRYSEGFVEFRPGRNPGEWLDELKDGVEELLSSHREIHTWSPPPLDS